MTVTHLFTLIPYLILKQTPKAKKLKNYIGITVKYCQTILKVFTQIFNPPKNAQNQ